MIIKPPSAQVAFLALLLMIAMTPLFAGPPSLIDYDNHVVRAMLLAHPSAAAAYVPDWGIKPNLAMDAFIWLAAKVMPVEVAARLFVGLTLTALLAGAAAVARVVHGRLGVVHAASAAFLYNICLGHGLLAFLFGLGLAMLAFAGWMVCAARHPAAKLAIFTPVCAILFFCHLFALASFGFVAGAWEIGQRRGWRDTMENLVTLGIAAIPSVTLLFAVPVGPSDTPLVAWSPVLPHLGRLFLGPFLFGTSADLGHAIAVVAAFGALLARGRPPLLASPLVLPVLGVWALAVVFPEGILGGWMVDARLPILGTLLLIAALPPKILPNRAAPVFAVIVLALTTWRAIDVAALDRDDAGRRRAVAAVEQVIPRGARVVISRDDKVDHLRLMHQFDYLAVDRDAFVTTLNAQRDQQPLMVAPAYAGIDVGRRAYVVPIQELVQALTPAGQAGMLRNPTADLKPYRGTPWFFGWQDKFDYLVLLEEGGTDAGLPELLDEVARGSFFRVYRLRHRA